MTPTFSVCIVVRDRPVLVLDAVRSVLAGDYTAFEVVLVDDGSSVPVAEVLRTAGVCDPRIRVTRQAPLGIAVARNSAVAQARGEYVTVLDSDDELAPDALSRLASALGGAGRDWVYADYEEASSHARRVIRLPSYDSVASMRGAILTRPRVPFKHSGMTVRRDLLLALGGYDESLAIKVDVELILRALEAGIHPHHLPHPIVRFHRHSGNVSRRRLLGIRTWLVLIDRYCPPRPVGYRVGVKALRTGSEMGKWLVGIGG